MSSAQNSAALSRARFQVAELGTASALRAMIINEHSRLCLSRDANNNLIQAHCTGRASQRYRTVDAGFDALFGGDVLRSNGRCLSRITGESQPRMITSCSTNDADRRWFKDFI